MMATSAAPAETRPLFSAVTNSARQLLQILRSISFVPKAHVEITPKGLWVTTEDSKVMKGKAFLDKELFTNYAFHPPRDAGAAGAEDPEPERPVFQISLDALLETLQIFGAHDARDRWPGRDGGLSGGVTEALARGGGGPGAAFDGRVLGLAGGVCRLAYAETGAPLAVTLEEAGVTTVCELATYEPAPAADIALRKDALAHKVIMRAAWLHDAVAELAAVDPTRLTLLAAPPGASAGPVFSLAADGPHGSATVEFGQDPQLLETFVVPRRVVNAYKYGMIRGASRAMALAAKVSIRADVEGVLSLQFMIEVEGGGVSFVDFTFVPYLDEEEEEDEGAGDEEDSNAGFD